MTNFPRERPLFDPETAEFRLKERLTDLFFEEDWFVATGVTRIGDRPAAFLTVDRRALSPKLIFAGFGRVFNEVYGELYEAGIGPSEFYLNADDIFQVEIPGQFRVRGPRLSIEMINGDAELTMSLPSLMPHPVIGGQRVRVSGQLGAGTVATTVTHRYGPMLLTNQHVLVAAHPGDPIEVEVNGTWQVAGTYESGTCTDVPTRSGPVTVDAALARLTSPAAPTGLIDGLSGTVHPYTTYDVDTPVQKVGACTGLTTGVITSVTGNVKINGVLFRNQILVWSGDPFQEPGDSGSLLTTAGDTPAVVGLLHGRITDGSQIGTAVASHWEAVALSQSVTL